MRVRTDSIVSEANENFNLNGSTQSGSFSLPKNKENRSVTSCLIQLTPEDVMEMKSELSHSNAGFGGKCELLEKPKLPVGGYVNPTQEGTSLKIKKMLSEDSEKHPYHRWMRKTDSVRLNHPPNVHEISNKTPRVSCGKRFSVPNEIIFNVECKENDHSEEYATGIVLK